MISCAGTIGELYELPKDAPRGLLNQALMRVRVDEKIILKGFFKYIFLNAVDKLTATKSNGSAIKNIPPFSDIKGTEILLPSHKEQQKLSLFLGSIDEIITLHQRE